LDRRKSLRDPAGGEEAGATKRSARRRE